MNMQFPTKEQLNNMTIEQIRKVVIIENSDQEAMVQEVINEKMMTEPIASDALPSLSADQTDIQSPKEEAEVQAKLDQKRHDFRVGSQVKSTVEPVVEKKEEKVEKVFCTICGGKTKHLKTCPTLNADV